MMRKLVHGLRGWLILLALTAALPAWAQTPRGPQVRAVATLVTDPAGAHLEVRLVRAPTAPLVGSFTGEVTFDPRFTVSGAEVPGGLLLDWNPVAPGRVRFAGVSTAGIGDGPVLTLRLGGRVAAPAPTAVQLSEATGTDAHVRLAP
jgi:hypothetical protein